jgi:hypothetical protein
MISIENFWYVLLGEESFKQEVFYQTIQNFMCLLYVKWYTM